MSGSSDDRKPLPTAFSAAVLFVLGMGLVAACGGSGLEGQAPGADGAHMDDGAGDTFTTDDGGPDVDDVPAVDDVADVADVADVPSVDDVDDAGDGDDGDDVDDAGMASDLPAPPADIIDSRCAGLEDGAACDDGNPCTSNDTCAGGRCTATAATICDDANPCTDDRCDVRSGCIHDPNLAPCDDGNPCTSNDICRARTCIGGRPTCDDANPCTRDLCDASGQCAFVPDDDLTCEDGSDCTSHDFCSNGFCIGGLGDGCDSGSPCATGTCAADGRRCEVAVTNGNPCDDGNACTDGDTCQNGQCISGGPRDCGWDTGCADFRCDPLSGCSLARLFAPLTPCDDGDRCTSDSACNAAGRCIAGAFVTCDDANPCTTDACLPDRGCQYLPVDAVPCDDMDACTSNDRCTNGTCRGATVGCNDADPCTLDRCDPLVGCVSTPILCNDGNPCTTDRCGPGGVCVFEPAPGPCDDGKACTSNDRCDNGACVGANVCDDQDPCTRDFCDAEEGCVFVPFTGPCDDGDVCTRGEMCDADGFCGGGLVLVAVDDGIDCTDDLCSDTPTGLHVPVPQRCGDGEGCSTTDGCRDAAGFVRIEHVVVAVVDPEGGPDIAVDGLLVAVVAGADIHLDLFDHAIRYGQPSVLAPIFAIDGDGDATSIAVDPFETVLLLDAGPFIPALAATALPARLAGYFGVPGDPVTFSVDDDVVALLSPAGRVIAATPDEPEP